MKPLTKRDRFCDGLAEGLGITAAGELVGWDGKRARGEFKRIRRQLGWQAV